MATKNQKVHGIIHTSSAAAAAVGAGLAQLPGSDAPILMGVQTAMIVSVADVHGASVTKATAAKLLLTFSATMAGRTASQVLIGWLPGIGNAANAATAAALTQAVGWAADAYFEDAALSRTTTRTVTIMANDLINHAKPFVDAIPEVHKRFGASAGIAAAIGATLGSILGGPRGALAGAALGGALGAAAGDQLGGRRR